MLVIGTTSELGFLREVGLHRAFGTALQIPSLTQRGAFEAALRNRPNFGPELLGIPRRLSHFSWLVAAVCSAPHGQVSLGHAPH